MPQGSHRDRIKKGRQDESASSEPAVAPRRSLRERKRPPVIDDIEDVDANIDSEHDSGADYEARRRDGRRLGDDDEEEDNGSDEEGDDDSGNGGGNGDGSDDEDLGDPPAIRPPVYAYRKTPVDYSKEKMVGAVKRNRDEDPYSQPKFNGDPRFWNQFQQDYYATVIVKKPKITHEAQWVDWEFMARKRNDIFRQVLDACEDKGIKGLMGFKQDWNKEIIAQFYATVHFGQWKGERAMFWMTENERYHCTYNFFARILNLREEDHLYRKIHDSGVIAVSDMSFMYPRNERASWGKVKGLYSYYALLYRLFRKTLTPRDGNTSDITLYQRNLMAAMKPGEGDFCVGDFLWQEIKAVSENPQKTCSYSPYIMYIIRKVTDISYPSDTSHDALRPKVKAPRVPSPRDEDEIMADPPEHPQQQFEQPAADLGTGGLTASPRRSNRLSQSPPRRPRSPIKRWLKYFQGICKTQRDIQVAQREEMIKNKKMRDKIKEIHNATVPLAEGSTRSPPSPMPAEWSVPIPSYEEQLNQYEADGICDQMGSMFSQYLDIPMAPPPYSAPMQFPPSYGQFPGPSYAGYYGVPPSFPYDPYSGGQGSSSAPPQPDVGQAAAEAVFGSLSVPAPSWGTPPSEGGNGDDPQ